MTRTQEHPLQIITIQLDNALNDDQSRQAVRLNQCAETIAEAVRGRAPAVPALCVLPAYFNGIYAYDDRFAPQAEAPDGITFQWAREHAEHHNLYLAGAWLIQDSGDVFTSAFLIAPDGQYWRYDAQHPFLWERAYYREGASPPIAHTPIGRIGLVIGWDGAFPDVWARFGGRVDAVVMMGAIPDAHTLQIIAPDDSITEVSNLGFVMRYIALNVTRWVKTLPMQAHWLRVPIACAGLSGILHTEVPAPRLSGYVLFIERDDLRTNIGENLRIQAHLKRITQIIGADGQPMARTTADGSAWLREQVILPAMRPIPDNAPPATDLPASFRYGWLPLLQSGLILNYRRIARRQWGAKMAQTEMKTYWWRGVLAIVGGASLLIGYVLGRATRPTKQSHKRSHKQ